MAQTFKALQVHDRDSVDYSLAAAVDAGDVVVETYLQSVASEDIAAGTAGIVRASTTWRGVFDVLKVNLSIPLGSVLYWDADGVPAGGTATGAATPDSTTGYFLGYALEAVVNPMTEKVRVYVPGPTLVTTTVRNGFTTVVTDEASGNTLTMEANTGGGDAGHIGTGGYVELHTGGAENRPLAVPTSSGIVLEIVGMTLVGAVTMVAVAPCTVNNAANTTFTFTQTGDTVTVISTRTAAATYVWRTIYNDGVALS